MQLSCSITTKDPSWNIRDTLFTKWEVLGDCFLISSLPGKVSSMHVELLVLALWRVSTCVLEAEPGKLDIKRCEPGILIISTHQTSNYYLIIDFSVDSTSSITFKQCNVIIYLQKYPLILSILKFLHKNTKSCITLPACSDFLSLSYIFYPRRTT